MSRVLVIEDETVLRSNVARGIAKLGVEVVEASCLNDALHSIDQQAPDVIVSDIDMPERSGLELLGELGRRTLKLPVIFVSGYLNAYRAQIPHHAAVDVLEKPVPIEELRDAVKRRLGAPRAAEAAPFTVPDYVQLACLGKHSVQIDVEKAGEHVGTVLIANGEIWSARDRKGSGLEALGRLGFASGGSARCRSFTGVLPPRGLEGGWEFLMMEAARVTDEGEKRAEEAFETAFEQLGGPASGARAARSVSDPITEAFDEAWEPRRDDAEASFEEAWSDGVDALLIKDYRTALAAFTRAATLRPDDSKVRANLKRLAELGHTGNGSNEK